MFCIDPLTVNPFCEYRFMPTPSERESYKLLNCRLDVFALSQPTVMTWPM